MKKTSYLIFILVLFILLFPTRDLSSTSPLVDRSLVPLKATSQLTSHLPIIIDGNADFASQAASEGWPGNGSKINPYMIADFIFQGLEGTGVTMYNIDVHFSVTNCTFNNEDSTVTGIFLVNVSSGTFSQNVLHLGMHISASRGILIWDSKNLNIIQNTMTKGVLGVKLENSYNISLIGNTFREYDDLGIEIFNSSTLVIRANTIESNYSYGSIFAEMVCNLSIADNFIIGRSIRLYDTRDATVYNNTLLINVFWVIYGIFLFNSSNNFISNNTIFEASWGIFLENYSNNNTIADNYIVDCGYAGFAYGDGLCIQQSSHNLVKNNIIKNSLGAGISLVNAPLNSILGNRMFNDELIFTGDIFTDYIQKEVVNNTINGKPILYWVNESDQTVPAGVSEIILFNCHRTSIVNQILEFIQLINCSNILIMNNSVNGTSRYGIILENSSTTNITSNIGPNIKLVKSHQVLIQNNSCGPNIKLINSHQVLIQNNSCGKTVDLYDCSQINFLKNTAEFLYFGGCSEIILQENQISNGSEGVYLHECTNITLQENLITNTTLGIFMINDCSQIYILKNTISNSSTGIHFGSDITDCHVDLNVFYMNDLAININRFSSTDILVTRNLFIIHPEAELQVEDEGLNNLFIGNYWSDWVGPDLDYDGIVDTPYPIGLDNQDPLPWVFPENISMFDYLFPPYIVSPVAHEVLQGKITVIWEPAFDIQGHPVTYTALYSPNLGITWILIATDIESTSLTWDASSLPSGSNYQLKIVATCSGGKTAFTVSSEPFYIKKVITTLTTTFETTSQSKTPIPAISFSFFLLHAIFLVILKRRLDRKEK